jgi:DNA-binding CsgD family transcriptional regulator
VTKPIKPKEVLARIAAHVTNARQARQARNALDAFGHATLVVRAADGKLVWQTALARKLLVDYFGSDEHAPPVVQEWLRVQRSRGEPAPLAVERGARRLSFALHAATDDDDQWLVVLREASDQAMIEAMSLAFRLTAREAEVLYWVVKGKTNRDIGDILGLSPRTVTKHLEHVFQKLGVETRTAAAGLAISRVRQLG